jgi:hypothetical protein
VQDRLEGVDRFAFGDGTTFEPYWLYWSETQLTRFSAPRL